MKFVQEEHVQRIPDSFRNKKIKAPENHVINRATC